jgi:BirA family biotin operon repressor/biotin-[acetyl-CoA-carboxylase] ligase
MAPDSLAVAVTALSAPWHGHYFEEVESTQDEARAAAGAGAPNRSVFVANYQRAGRGRQNRSWVAAPGSALLLSLLFREAAANPMPWRWTSLASVALVGAIRDVAPSCEPEIKWPNDIMLDGRKVAGILAETSWNGDELIAIVGAGVNVNSDAPELALAPMATSLRLAGGHCVDRGELLDALIARIDTWLERSREELFAAWHGLLWGRGQRVRLLDLGTEQEVVVLGAAADGSLLVRLPDGNQRRTTTGELIP